LDVVSDGRPLGFLLDNVANGWSYNIVKWSDVAQHGGAAAGQVSLSLQHCWSWLCCGAINTSFLPPAVFFVSATDPASTCNFSFFCGALHLGNLVLLLLLPCTAATTAASG
jgi:hypothetical protein